MARELKLFSRRGPIWAAYAGIAVFLAAVLVWFSWTTIRLDIERERNQRRVDEARRNAELQDRIGYALWRMDWALTPLVAQEAARTHWMYQSFIDTSAAPSEIVRGAQATPSPLLIQPSPFVILHFQIDENGVVESPQAPSPERRMDAIVCGLAPDDLEGNLKRLDEISRFCQFDNLWDRCSERKLPDVAASSITRMLNDTANPATQVAPAPGTAQRAAPSQLVDNFSQNENRNNSTPPPLASDEPNSNISTRYDQRQAAANEFALNQWVVNRSRSDVPIEQRVVEGVMRPLWIEQHLILARRVEAKGRSTIQCCWLDWSAIRDALLRDIAAIVPSADLIPRTEDHHVEFSRVLATLPVELVVPQQLESAAKITPTGFSGWRSALEFGPSRPVCASLAIAWGGFLFAAASIAWLIFGIVRLSDRRAAFASAVTHELRTPLTTFRLYSEMLAAGMVANEQQRQEYAQGLVSESDRLCRLVDNVLQFSRLERASPPPRSEALPVAALAERLTARCAARVAGADMTWQTHVDPAVESRFVETSPDVVDQIVFNLVDNAAKYGRSAGQSQVRLEFELDAGWLVVRVRDFGPGIDRQLAGRLFQPFARSSDETAGTAAGVGLGLALSRQLARQLGGRLDYFPADPGCAFELRLKITQTPYKPLPPTA